MADTNNNVYKYHISQEERNKWDKNIEDLANHIGAGGTKNHMLGNGSVAGFSINDYTTAEKNKLAGIEDGALNNPHPATHPATMITGLSTVATSGEFKDLKNIPNTCYVAEKGNCDTVGGIRFTVGSSAPSSPVNYKDVWFDTSNKLLKVYYGSAWVAFGAVWL